MGVCCTSREVSSEEAYAGVNPALATPGKDAGELAKNSTKMNAELGKPNLDQLLNSVQDEGQEEEPLVDDKCKYIAKETPGMSASEKHLVGESKEVKASENPYAETPVVKADETPQIEARSLKNSVVSTSQ